MSNGNSYAEKLRDPRWLLKRRGILEARGNACELCGGGLNLTIHHGYYRPKGNPWEYEEGTLWVLCWSCHEKVQEKVIRLHRQVAYTHPRDLDDLFARVDDVAHEVQYGIMKKEFEEILEEEMEAQSTLYSDYTATIVACGDLGPSIAHEIEDAAEKEFPGISIFLSQEEGSPDGATMVEGPDGEVRQSVQAWFDAARER
jgi:hypothetical protein